MSESEKLPAGTSGQDSDPLLNDFDERKQRLRQNVVLLAAELKEARSRLALQEEALFTETLTRKETEIKTKLLEDEIFLLRKRFDEQELQASASTSVKYEKEIDDLRCRLECAQAAANDSEEKNRFLKDGEDRMNQIEEQLEIIWRELREREATQKQLKDKIRKIEQDIMQLVIVALVSKDRELRRTLDEVLDVKSKTEIVSCHWKMKTEQLESQLKERRLADQEIMDRVLKLEMQLEQASEHSLMKLRGITSLSSLVYEWLWANLRNYVH